MKDFSQQSFTQKPVRLVTPRAGIPAGSSRLKTGLLLAPPAPGRATPRVGFLVVALICAYLAGVLTAAAFGG